MGTDQGVGTDQGPGIDLSTTYERGSDKRVLRAF